MIAKHEKTNAIQAKFEQNSIIGTQSTLKSLVLENPSIQKALRRLAPKHLNAERLARMVLTAASRNPTLLQCTQASMLKSVIEASTLGLDCSGLLGRGYLVPYKNGSLSRAAGHDVYEAQFMPGYLGLCDLARRSNEIARVEGHAVFDGDVFEYEEGLNQKLVHKPSLDANQEREVRVVVTDYKQGLSRVEGSLKFVYAIAVYKDGGKQFVVMSVAEVERHRQRSRAKNSGPWVTDYVAMAIKTAIRQLCKWIPQSPELAKAMTIENEIDGGEMDVIDITAKTIDGRTRTENLLDRLESGTSKPASESPDKGTVESKPEPQSEPTQQTESKTASTEPSDALNML